MSARELKDGHDWVTKRFYRLGRIIQRTWRFMRRPIGLNSLLFFLSVNLAYYGRIRAWKIRGHNPAYSQIADPQYESNSMLNIHHGLDYHSLQQLSKMLG